VIVEKNIKFLFIHFDSTKRPSIKMALILTDNKGANLLGYLF